MESTDARLIPIWPPNDKSHIHSEDPPTPEDLLLRANFLAMERLNAG